MPKLSRTTLPGSEELSSSAQTLLLSSSLGPPHEIERKSIRTVPITHLQIVVSVAVLTPDTFHRDRIDAARSGGRSSLFLFWSALPPSIAPRSKRCQRVVNHRE